MSGPRCVRLPFHFIQRYSFRPGRTRRSRLRAGFEPAVSLGACLSSLTDSVSHHTAAVTFAHGIRFVARNASCQGPARASASMAAAHAISVYSDREIRRRPAASRASRFTALSTVRLVGSFAMLSRIRAHRAESQPPEV